MLISTKGVQVDHQEPQAQVANLEHLEALVPRKASASIYCKKILTPTKEVRAEHQECQGYLELQVQVDSLEHLAVQDLRSFHFFRWI